MNTKTRPTRFEWHLAIPFVFLFISISHSYADNGVPTPNKVVIVIEENHGYSQIIGSASAPYINQLASAGALMTQCYAVTHPSQPNYIALFSGSTQGVTSDSVYPHSQFTAPNLAANLLASPNGYTFGGYSETMPSVGYDGASSGTAPATYQRKHNPWVNWQDSTIPLPANKLPPSVNMPYAGFFPSDYSTLPTLSFVIPNQANDMHDGTIAQGDTWLSNNLAAYATWCQTHNSLLIVTFDEDNGGENNRIVTIFYGPMVVPGQYPESITHYNVLRTLEDMFGLPHAANTVALAPILDIWGIQAPVNNNCANATVKGNGTFAFSTLGATTDGPDEPGACTVGGFSQITNDIWYKYLASCTGIATVSLCGSAFNTKMAVYQACPTGSGQALACNDDYCGTSSQVSFAVNQGTVYRFRIGGVNGTSGTGTMTISCAVPPPPCPADINGDHNVNVTDLLGIINGWGACPPPCPRYCSADINHDCNINVSDLLAVINAWGPCP